ncbi:MAG: GNAT family N-acetyltransferase [Methanomicrobiales archaeon]|nr:GNAT family N-acetyltransferase [Methanomicrobiales archaeon]MDI6877174.1 GNAT family N-acetyltransferase [Methanomicrobiales archaeon]
MRVGIRPLEPGREEEWERFVRSHEETTFFTQIGWRNVVEGVYRHQPLYLYAEDGSGEMIGILPLFQVRSPFSGPRLVSLPYAPYGGIYCRNAAVSDAFLEELKRMASRGMSIELRHVGDGAPPEGFGSRNGYCTSILDLSPGPDRILGAMDKTCRTAIRKGERADYAAKFSSDSAGVARFYDIYLETMQRLGTPPHPPALFSALLQEFGDGILIAEAWKGDTPVAALFLLGMRKTLVSGWAVSRWEYRTSAPNNFIYWHAIQEAIERGYRSFDFGRSLQGSGIHAFKTRWGARDVPLRHWVYPAGAGGGMPQAEYGRLAKVWSRVPLVAARILGPELRRWIV